MPLVPRAEGKEAVGKVPERATDSTLAVTVSLESISVTVNVPAALMLALISDRDAASPAVLSLAEITGVSLVPVMVTVTVSLSLSGIALLSVAVTV